MVRVVWKRTFTNGSSNGWLYHGLLEKVKKQHLELDMKQQTVSKLEKGTLGCVLSPCVFNLCAEYIMGNAWLDESQAGIKISGRNISSLRYVDDTTLTAEIV